MLKLLEVCHQVGMPMASDKLIPPCQVIKFLGLLLDSLLMVIRVPEDKTEVFVGDDHLGSQEQESYY